MIYYVTAGVGVLILLLASFMAWRGVFRQEGSVRIFLGTVVCVLSVLLLVAGYGPAQISPVIGIFGVMIGSLFRDMTRLGRRRKPKL